MKYLVFAVFQDSGSNQIATHSKEMDLGFNDPEDRAEDIIDHIVGSGLSKTNLWEVFVFKSAQNYGDAPEQVAYWNLDDGLFGEQEDDEEDEDEDEDSDQG